MNWYICRHGQTYFSKNDIDYGREIHSAEILDEGRPVTKKIAHFLSGIPTDVNLCSEYKRCRQTAEIISKITNKEFIFDSRLNEYFDESFDHLRSRVQNLIQEMEEKKYKNILIVTHGGVMSALKYLLTVGKYEDKNLMDYPPTGNVLKITNNNLEILNFNE